MRIRLLDKSGYTVIEVLVAAVIFMVGFSILIGLMNSSLVKLSTKEMELATNLGNEMMARSLVTADTTAMDTIVVRSGMRFRLERTVNIDAGLVGISLSVHRVSNNKKLLELYNAFVRDKK